MARRKKATSGYARLHDCGLTLAQQNAVALLVAGKNDTETAAALGLNRVTVTRWRLYSPIFQAELNVRRAEVWAVGAAKLQGLVSDALDVLAEGLRDGIFASRLAVARDVLKLAGQPSVPAAGPTDPADIVWQVVRNRREAADVAADHREVFRGLPPFEDHCVQVWDELNERAGPAEPTEAGPLARSPVASARPALEALTMGPTAPLETNDHAESESELGGEQEEDE